jgi:hypothetical protein
VRRGTTARTLPGLRLKRRGLLGSVLLAWSNRQSGPTGLQSSGLLTQGVERALSRGHRTRVWRGGAVPTVSPVAKVSIDVERQTRWARSQGGGSPRRWHDNGVAERPQRDGDRRWREFERLPTLLRGTHVALRE